MTEPEAQRGRPGRPQRRDIHDIVDDRWRTLATGVMPDGTETLSGLYRRLVDPVDDLACRLVHGLAGKPASGNERTDTNEQLVRTYERELEDLEQLRVDVHRFVEQRIKSFAVDILERREEVTR